MFNIEIFQTDELFEQSFENLDKLVHVNFVKVVEWKDFREKGIQEELQLLLMLTRSWKD